jgi:hypothetical protein
MSNESYGPRCITGAPRALDNALTMHGGRQLTRLGYAARDERAGQLNGLRITSAKGQKLT